MYGKGTGQGSQQGFFGYLGIIEMSPDNDTAEKWFRTGLWPGDSYCSNHGNTWEMA